MPWLLSFSTPEYIGLAIIGFFAVIGIFNTAGRLRRADSDQTATNLISNLKTTVDLQEKELINLRAKEISQGKDIAHLQGQVKVLSDILQGRDPAMSAFLQDAPTLIEMAKANSAAITKLTDTISDLVTAMRVQTTS